LPALFLRWCNGFFQQYIIARIQRCQAGFGVQMVRSGNDDGIRKFLLAENFIPVIEAIGIPDIVTMLDGITTFGVDIRNRNYFQFIRMLNGIIRIYATPVSCT